MKKENELLPIGTPVYDIRYGWGKVTSYNLDNQYVLRCDFNQNDSSYTSKGHLVKTHKTPLLSLTEYSLEKGGFTSIELYQTMPKVGDWGYFWDKPNDTCAIYAQLKAIEDCVHPFYNEVDYYRYFSKEVPKHIKNLQEDEKED